jgi:hypothetical protein
VSTSDGGHVPMRAARTQSVEQRSSADKDLRARLWSDIHRANTTTKNVGGMRHRLQDLAGDQRKGRKKWARGRRGGGEGEINGRKLLTSRAPSAMTTAEFRMFRVTNACLPAQRFYGGGDRDVRATKGTIAGATKGTIAGATKGTIAGATEGAVLEVHSAPMCDLVKSGDESEVCDIYIRVISCIRLGASRLAHGGARRDCLTKGESSV